MVASADEKELENVGAEMQYLEQTAEALGQRMQMLTAARSDLLYAKATVEGLEKEKENVEMLVPIGGSTYLKVKLAYLKLIVTLGAGVSVEKTLAETKESLQQRMDEIEKNIQVGQQQYAEVAKRIEQVRNRFQVLISAPTGKP